MVTSNLSPEQRKHTEEIKSLKATIVKQEEDIETLKDMVRSTALQIKVKE
jgi:hypothetical protein